jgi:hypothetical protein
VNVQTRRLKLQTANTKTIEQCEKMKDMGESIIKQFLIKYAVCIENDAQVLSINTFHEQLASIEKKTEIDQIQEEG